MLAVILSSLIGQETICHYTNGIEYFKGTAKDEDECLHSATGEYHP